MRGKRRILWLSWIAILLSVGMIELGSAAVTNTKIIVEPDMVTGVPIGGSFWIFVNIENAKNVYAFQFKLRYQPGSSIIAALDYKEGGFLGSGALFVGKVEPVQGYVFIGCTLVGAKPGKSGDGCLARIKMNVIDAGECPIWLDDSILLDPSVQPLPHQTKDGYYKGPVVNLVMAGLGEDSRRDMLVGETMEFTSKVKNEGDVPLMVMVRWDMVRDDMTPVRLGAGQLYLGTGPITSEYLYVDGWNGGYDQWYNEGDSMVGHPDGNYMWADQYCSLSRFYTFEDIDLAGRLVSNVDFQGYTSQPDGNTAWDFDPYVLPWFAWCDSMGGTADWAWTGGRYYQGSAYDMPEYYIMDALHNEEAINNAMVTIHNYCPSGPRQLIDAMRMQVFFSKYNPTSIPIYVVEPGETLKLPLASWILTEHDVGKYFTTVTCYFSYLGLDWNRGRKVKTFTWWVNEA